MIWEVTRAESELKLCSTIIDKEILHGEEDDDEKEEGKNRKSEETDHLCLFNLWEGHQDTFPSVLTC